MLLAMTIAKAMQMGGQVTWDAQSLMIDGQRVCPVMGEVHYSRLPAAEWPQAIRRMKEGGVTVIATYVFWNHIEEQEGIFRWDGQRDLRRFIQLCKQEQMPVVLRIGPFCHGEVRCGGIPDWVFSKSLTPTIPHREGEVTKIRVRTEQPEFLELVERLYRQIFTQVQGLQWKDGGPVLACQFDNEYRGSGSYLMALKRIALQAGFDLPFYTRTGWPELSRPVPYGEMLPLFGDYADGFWDRSLEETAGNYYCAFNFRAPTAAEAGAMGDLDTSVEASSTLPAEQVSRPYPYFTCELGGGMMPSYHRRVYLYPEDAYSMALVKLGSGSNLLGYYMYHGGTNPESSTGITLNETQRTAATNYNDLPVKNYDFQAPLGEFGQTNPHYYMLRPLHLFMHDFDSLLAPMQSRFPCEQNIPKGDDSHLRWAYREKDGNGFIFVNNYERLQSLSAKKNVELKACGVTLPKLTIPANAMFILPVNIEGMRYATAQMVAKREGKIYLMQIEGVPTSIALQNGKVLHNVKPRGTSKPVVGNLYLLTRAEAERLFLNDEELPAAQKACGTATLRKLQEAGTSRQISIGVNKAAEEPVDEDFQQAAVYEIQLSNDHSGLLQIDYRGDVARLYANGKLIADNFYNGRPFLYGLWRLPAEVNSLELRILPLQPEMPVYFPREADTTPGEAVLNISIINCP